jgi:NAD(P)-dependent dehydrogenase (short-subunit alcohol dehydrogenase family)
MTAARAQTMLVSGGSRGIGRATALAAAEAGWRVALTYRSDAESAADVVRASEALGGAAVALEGDTAREADVLRVFDEAEARLGPLGAVVVNAGIVGPKATLAEMPLDRLTRMVETNLLGALLFAREAARRLAPPPDGPDASLVLVSSAAARLGAPGEYVDYAATKGALDTLTVGLAKELAPRRIRVNGVRPGLIDTDIHASGGQPDRAERVGRTVPMARPGRAEEVAAAILWLCSEGASYTTGAILDVAGGR